MEDDKQWWPILGNVPEPDPPFEKSYIANINFKFIFLQFFETFRTMEKNHQVPQLSKLQEHMNGFGKLNIISFQNYKFYIMYDFHRRSRSGMG